MEVNGKAVHTPDELQQAIQAAKENLSLKVAPGISNDGNKSMKSIVSIPKGLIFNGVLLKFRGHV